MNWIIVLVAGIVLGITFAILSAHSYFHDSGFAIAATVAFVIAGISAIIIPVAWIGDRQNIQVFEQQKQYIESHQSKSTIEDAAITSKKIELNNDLFNIQYEISHYGGWNFYPPETKDLQPIK